MSGALVQGFRLVLSAVVVCSCGSPMPTGVSGPVPLDPSLAGTWSGPVAVAGGSPYTAQVVVVVDGQTATISQLCSDGTESFSVTGTGDSASGGALTCTVSGPNLADNAVFYFRDISVSLSADILSMSGGGKVSLTDLHSILATHLTFQGTRR
jgi:hypothetical protein